MNEYLNLRNAIIRQAVIDYQEATRYVRKWRHRPKNYDQEARYRHMERLLVEVDIFFRSDWAKTLCGEVDPMMIYEHIKAEARVTKASAIHGGRYDERAVERPIRARAWN